jgi:hypothetical protein
MPTRIIDASLHGSTIPATYTGPGTLAGNCVQAGGGAVPDVYGNFTSDGNVVQINCGFRPLLVDITDVAGVLMWQWQLGMPATNSIKTATAAVTVDATSGIVVTVDLAGNGTVTLSAALVGSGKNILFHIAG